MLRRSLFKLVTLVLTLVLILQANPCWCWGFFGHKRINYYAVFLLPPEMLVLYKPNIEFLEEHATDPDKRRYAVPEEGPRHFIDIDHYGQYPYPSLPRRWNDAVAKFGEDSLMTYGIVPWHIQTMLYRLTTAFKEKNFSSIMRYSAEIGHYISDSHVPLHASSNHNGQFSNQKGIHGFWESRVPELLADKEWNFFIGAAQHISKPLDYCWQRVMESALASDSVLKMEKQLTAKYSPDQKYSFENRNGVIIRQYSAAFTRDFDAMMQGMVERRMRLSIFSVASFWYTAWVNAGQPDLKAMSGQKFSEAEIEEFDKLNRSWNTGGKMIGREED